jgi:shikimate dehydrogenase
MISGTTLVIGIVGHPVALVRMPGVLNRLFAETGRDLAMVPFDIRPEGVDGFVAMLRTAANVIGTVVTVPHKQAVASQVDVLTPRARALGAVNVVRREADGRLHGDHVDGFGFLNAARAYGFRSSGRSALVIGAGGAGSAIAYALCETGIASLTILDTDDARARRIAGIAAEQFPGTEVRTARDTLAELDLLVNVTPLGMREMDPMPLPDALLASLTPATLVADAVTSPVMTRLLTFAAARGCRVQTGVEMADASVHFIGGFLRVLPEVDPLATVTAPLS